MQNTENFDLKIYEGEDLFNPLVVENANAQAIDTQMKKNENHAVGDATELASGTVHALTRLTPDTPMLRFTATSRFTAGDTFTVDGVQVSALTVSGEQLPDGAYIIGSEVLAYLKGTLLTFFTSQSTLATAQNALKLGGNLPEYYATATAVQQAQDTATAAGNLANEVNSNLAQVGLSFDDVFITKSGFSINNALIYKKGNKVKAILKFNNSTTTDSVGRILPITIQEKYRPKSLQQTCTSLYNSSTSGNINKPCTILINTNGEVIVYTDTESKTIGSTTYSWSTAFTLEWDII